MALIMNVTWEIAWVPNTGGNSMIGQQQANVPGQGQTQQPHIIPVAQRTQYIDAEAIPVAAGSEGSVTLANIKTAADNASTTLAGATGTPLITAAQLAIIQGWASGNP